MTTRKLTNVTDTAVYVVGLGLVAPGATLDVDDDQADELSGRPEFTPKPTKARKATNKKSTKPETEEAST